MDSVCQHKSDLSENFKQDQKKGIKRLAQQIYKQQSITPTEIQAIAKND
jgi:hypothetical protein